MMEFPMPQVDVNGTRLHYEEAGAGEPLLLLHGGLGTALLHWRRDIPFFAQHFHVYAPDLRGYGQSSPPRDFPPDFYERDAADMAAFIESVTGGSAHILGWSDGAMAALVLAVHRPELVRSMVLVGAEARMLPEEPSTWPAVVDTDAWGERALQRFIEAQGPKNWPGILQAMLDGYQSVFDRAGGQIIAHRVHEIRCPTFLVHGEKDTVVPVSHAYELHRDIPNAELHIYPDAGHQPYREHEDDFRARVLDFWKRRT
jgi:valacyclovir hydrolase